VVHAFHFASVSKQLICRYLNLFFKSNRKKLQIKFQVKSQSFESNLNSSNRISKCAKIYRDLNPNIEWDLSVTDNKVTECNDSFWLGVCSAVGSGV